MVEGVDLRLVDLSCLETDEFHRVGEDAPSEESIRLQVDVLGQLKPVKTFLASHCVHFGQDESPNCLLGAEFFEGALETFGFSQLHEVILVGSDDGHGKGVEGISVEEDLGDERALGIEAFNPVGG